MFSFLVVARRGAHVGNQATAFHTPDGNDTHGMLRKSLHFSPINPRSLCMFFCNKLPLALLLSTCTFNTYLVFLCFAFAQICKESRVHDIHRGILAWRRRRTRTAGLVI